MNILEPTNVAVFIVILRKTNVALVEVLEQEQGVQDCSRIIQLHMFTLLAADLMVIERIFHDVI